MRRRRVRRVRRLPADRSSPRRCRRPSCRTSRRCSRRAHGTIVLDLLADAAPNHVAHFITRAREGAYDGTIFHRVIAMGIIQGGDPLSKDPAQAAKYGTGGLGVLRFEPNAEKHTRGAVSAVLVPGQSRQRRHRSSSSASPISRRSTGSTPCSRASSRASPWRRRSRRCRRTMTVPGRAHRDPQGDDPREAGAGAGAVRRPRRSEELSQHRAVIETSMGNITHRAVSRPRAEPRAPVPAAGAVGVYDGTAFHRVVAGFVIQGGHLPTRREPLDERQQAYVRIAAAGVQRRRRTIAGIVSMARGDDPASATTLVLHRAGARRRRSTTSTRCSAASSRGWTCSRRSRPCR